MSLSRGLLSILSLMLPAFAAAADPFAIHVIDESTGRGVPLVTLTTTNHIAHTTDSAGWIAFEEPGLMDREVFFHVVSPGYAVGKDGFGYAGVRLTPKAGVITEVKVMRMNIAERLHRITGQGIYRDSELLGKPMPLPRPNFNFVTGQDSVQAVPWRGRLFWLWGDTNVAHYPLGNFHSTCAWSDLPEKGGLNPEEGVHLEYLTSDDGKLRKMMPTKEPGVVWIFGMLAVADSEGKEHLLGHYGRFKDLGKRLEHGLCEFDEAQGIFVSSTLLGDEFEWQHPEGNAFRVKDDEGEFFYFAQDFAVTRVRASYNDVLNPGSYEALAWSEPQQDYVWQKKLPPVSQRSEAKMLADKKMPEDRALLQVKDALTDKPIIIHRSSVNWNPHRKAWVMIGSQHFAPESVLGEVWYAEAPTPSGPWIKAVKVASHPRYTFYNPRHHVFFDQQGGRIIHFEGTYTETFSGNPVPTPRYDYNQLMYRLDLDDPRLEVVRKKAGK
ncbi:MAG: hypothetical protein V4662_26590 [Verrucomicrobiota bacterium]